MALLPRVAAEALLPRVTLTCKLLEEESLRRGGEDGGEPEEEEHYEEDEDEGEDGEEGQEESEDMIVQGIERDFQDNSEKTLSVKSG